MEKNIKLDYLNVRLLRSVRLQTQSTVCMFTDPEVDDAPELEQRSIACIEADFNRSADTHLVPLRLGGFPGIHFYFRTSRVIRPARSSIVWPVPCSSMRWPTAGCRARGAGDRGVEGSTAVSEAYFARLLGVPFIAVMPRATSPEKLAAIAFYGGTCHLIDDPAAIHDESVRLARETGGHFMDQFTYAERATDWRANNNIAESIFQQMRCEPCRSLPGSSRRPVPAGVGNHRPPCPVSPPPHPPSLSGPRRLRPFFRLSGRKPQGRRRLARALKGSGRPRVEASFLPQVIDAMIRVPDVWSLAAMHELSARLGYPVGGSSGTNLIGALWAGWSR